MFSGSGDKVDMDSHSSLDNNRCDVDFHSSLGNNLGNLIVSSIL